jgi:hypothetical protein
MTQMQAIPSFNRCGTLVLPTFGRAPWQIRPPTRAAGMSFGKRHRTISSASPSCLQRLHDAACCHEAPAEPGFDYCSGADVTEFFFEVRLRTLEAPRAPSRLMQLCLPVWAMQLLRDIESVELGTEKPPLAPSLQTSTTLFIVPPLPQCYFSTMTQSRTSGFGRDVIPHLRVLLMGRGCSIVLCIR